MNGFSPDLHGIPETMLWPLYNRASEALRTDARLADPKALDIYRAIDYDYEGRFGRADSSHAARSWMFDAALRSWLATHPRGQVVELGCGLETAYQRLSAEGWIGDQSWFCLDLPEAVAIRRRFLPETKACRYLERSAFDPAWMAEIDVEKSVFISAQGLFMFFDEAEIRALAAAIFGRFAEAALIFDTVPRWFSKKTTSEKGLWKTPHYRLPPMPWGVNRPEIAPLVKSWHHKIKTVEVAHYAWLRGFWGVVLPLFSRLPGLGNPWPFVVTVQSV